MPTIPDSVIAAIKCKLDGSESLSQVKSQLKHSREGLEEDQRAGWTDEIIEKISRELIARKPLLVVDWGENPRVGHRANPRFQVLCPGFQTTPRIHAAISRELDHEPGDVFPECKEEGLWEFSLPFSLTTDREDCRPGLYKINLNLSFPESPGASIPRFYNCDIRLNIKPNVKDGEEPILEIAGDGQSMVNLQGLDLTQYSKVKLNAADGAVVNISKSALEPKAKSSEPSRESVTCELELKVDLTRESQILHASTRFTNRMHMESAMFVTEDDRRILLLAKRVTTFGRNTQNDVVIRYLPRNEINDDISKDISRQHMVLEINKQGLSIHDKSSKGIALSVDVIEETHTLTADDVDDEIALYFGTDFLARGFEFEMQLFGKEENPHAQRDLVLKDELFASDSNQRFDKTGKLAANCEINAVRLRRSSNYEQEEYVLVYRHVFIGSSRTESAVTLYDYSIKPQHARIIYLNNTFWLENLQERESVQVDDQPIPRREMVPLEPGMKIQIGKSLLQFKTAEQFEF